MPVAIAALALILRVWAPGPVTQTQDEFNWLMRSTGFRNAVVHGDLERASASDVRTVGVTGPTMPGVTTMWAGTLGYWGVSLGHAVGLVDQPPEPFAGSVLRAGRAVVALWCSLAVGLLVAVGALLVGRRAAAIAGVLLATEPFLVGHSDVLHTDALVAMFGALSAVALLAARRAARPLQPAEPLEPAGPAGPVDPDHLQAPTPPPPQDPQGASAVPARARTLLTVLSGASAGVAALTKLNALPLVLGAAAVIVVVDAVVTGRRADRRPQWWRSLLRDHLRLVAVWGGAAAVVVIALWPALWVAPGNQIELIRLSLKQLKQGQGTTFFRQRLTSDAGVMYYPVALLFRMTPWFLVGALVSSLVVTFRFVRDRLASTRASAVNDVAAVLLAAVVPYGIVLASTSQKYDRYALPLFPFLAMACGVVLTDALAWWRRRGHLTRWVTPVGAVATALMAISTLNQAPYAISYVDPLAGGQVRARSNILLGWGEGLEVLGAEIRQREGPRCDDAQILAPLFYVVAFPCGKVVTFGEIGQDVQKLDYYVTFVGLEQRASPATERLLDSVRRAGTLVKAVTIDGVDYAELWKIDHRPRS